jgi:hypothetical protein
MFHGSRCHASAGSLWRLVSHSLRVPLALVLEIHLQPITWSPDGTSVRGNSFPSLVFQKRRVVFLDGCPSPQLIRARGGLVESRRVNFARKCGIQCALVK